VGACAAHSPILCFRTVHGVALSRVPPQFDEIASENDLIARHEVHLLTWLNARLMHALVML